MVQVKKNQKGRLSAVRSNELLARNGSPLEKSGGRYCNVESRECKKYGKLYSDDGGYICANCGGRVSKWLPLAMAISKIKG